MNIMKIGSYEAMNAQPSLCPPEPTLSQICADNLEDAVSALPPCACGGKAEVRKGNMVGCDTCNREIKAMFLEDWA